MTQPSPLAAASYYHHSGRFSAVGLLLALAGAAAAALILGAAYGPLGYCAQMMIPYTKLSAILVFAAVFGFSVALGFVAGHLCKWGRVRNTSVGLIVPTVAGLVGLYAAWVLWIFLLLLDDPNRPTLLQTASPSILWIIIRDVNAQGVWAISGNNLISGPALWFFWALEAGIILVTASVTARSVLNAVPFCETCQKWGSKRLLVQAAPANAGDIIRQCLQKDFTALAQASPKGASSSLWYDLFLEGCPNCDTLQCLTVEQVSETTNKRGQPVTKRKHLLQRLLLTPEDTLALAQAAATLKSQA